MVKVGVMGTGVMGRNHARVSATKNNLEGICDLDLDAASSVGELYGVSAFQDPEVFLSECDLDAVIVSTPTSTHYELGKMALDAGKHLLLEKPMCSSVDEAKELIELAKEKELVLSVGFIERHNPVVSFTRDLITKGTLGNIISISARRVSQYPARIRDVGVIMDLAVHDIDVLRYLTGDEVRTVYAQAGRTRHEKFEDHANIMLKYRSGISGYIETNWLTPMRVRKVYITCSKGFVVMDYIAQSVEISKSSYLDMDTTDLYHMATQHSKDTVFVRQEEPLKRQLNDFLRAIETGSDPFVTGEDGLRSLEIAQLSLKSYKEGRAMELQTTITG